MYCPKCGKELKDGALFCMYCGEKLSDNDLTGENISITSIQTDAKNDDTQSEDIGQAVSTTIEMPNTDEIKQEEVTIKHLLGKNHEYYLSEFAKIDRSEKTKFNLAAFFLGPWLTLYRKQKDLFVKYCLIPVVAQLLGSTIFAMGFMNFNFVPMAIGGIVSTIAGIASIILVILLGKRFNKLYYDNLKTILNNPSIPAKEKVTKAGVSVRNVVIYIVIITLVTSVISIAPYAGAGLGGNLFGEDDSLTGAEGVWRIDSYSDVVGGGVAAELTLVYGAYNFTVVHADGEAFYSGPYYVEETSSGNYVISLGIDPIEAYNYYSGNFETIDTVYFIYYPDYDELQIHFADSASGMDQDVVYGDIYNDDYFYRYSYL